MKKYLNITVVVDSFDYTLGGSAISAQRFVSALSKKGHNITLITNSVQNKKRVIFKNLKLIIVKDFFLLKWKNFSFSFVTKSKAKKILQQNNIQVLYVIYPATYSGRSFINAGKELDIKIISHFHVQAENLSMLFLKYNLENYVYKFFMHFYNKCALVICPTKFAENFAIKNGLKSKTEIISNGVNTSVFKKIEKNSLESIFQKYKIDNSKINFLYLGRLEKSKDIFTLLKAFKIISTRNVSAVLNIVGTGSLREEIVKYIKNNKLQNSVNFIGYVPFKDLVPVYNCNQVYVTPSLYELEGMAILEAMSCGLAVIVADSPTSSAPYLVEGNGFVFKSGSELDLVSKLRQILDSSELLSNQQRMSLELVKKYDFDRSVEKLDALFYEIRNLKSKIELKHNF